MLLLFCYILRVGHIYGTFSFYILSAWEFEFGGKVI